jgi:hydrogenase maturation protease
MTSLFIGIGNPYRRDDGAGLALAAKLRDLKLDGLKVMEATDDVIRLVDLWSRHDVVIIADAVDAGEEPGTLYRRDPLQCPLPRHWFALSSHQLGPVEAIELGRSMNRLPPHMLFLGIQGKEFSQGEGLTPQVAQAIDIAAEVVRAELKACPVE